MSDTKKYYKKLKLDKTQLTLDLILAEVLNYKKNLEEEKAARKKWEDKTSEQFIEIFGYLKKCRDMQDLEHNQVLDYLCKGQDALILEHKEVLNYLKREDNLQALERKRVLDYLQKEQENIFACSKALVNKILTMENKDAV